MTRLSPPVLHVLTRAHRGCPDFSVTGWTRKAAAAGAGLPGWAVTQWWIHVGGSGRAVLGHGGQSWSVEDEETRNSFRSRGSPRRASKPQALGRCCQALVIGTRGRARGTLRWREGLSLRRCLHCEQRIFWRQKEYGLSALKSLTFNFLCKMKIKIIISTSWVCRKNTKWV